jgi:hypothetical protein
MGIALNSPSGGLRLLSGVFVPAAGTIVGYILYG